MPASKGTRRGNGAGYGGPARGDKPPVSVGGRPSPHAAAVIAMAKAERLEALKANLIKLAIEAERDNDRIAATLGFLRHEEAPPQRVELTGAEGAPMEIIRRIIDPASN